MKLCYAALAILFVICIYADDLATKSGTIYKNYTIDKATPYGLSIFHDDGGATVPYADLPDDIRAKYREAEKMLRQKSPVSKKQESNKKQKQSKKSHWKRPKRYCQTRNA